MEHNGLTCFTYTFNRGVSSVYEREACSLKVLFCKLLDVGVLLLTLLCCLALCYVPLYQSILKDQFLITFKTTLNCPLCDIKAHIRTSSRCQRCKKTCHANHTLQTMHIPKVRGHVKIYL